LPLDIRATAFQAQVWAALRDIPPGETRTYGEIARALGRPKGARAVGRACASNPVAVVIPCHRAIGGDGNLHGYRWGLARKQALLEREKDAAGKTEDTAA
jgi:AraC family transcriptional regulator of adaptative response/methylated-DNA-[protein]-cysteine methyltransferase